MVQRSARDLGSLFTECKALLFGFIFSRISLLTFFRKKNFPNSFSLLFIQLVRTLPITNLRRELPNCLTSEGIDLLTKLYNIIKIGFSVFLSRLPTPTFVWLSSLLWSHDGDQPTPPVILLKLEIQQERDRTTDSDRSEVHSHWTNCGHVWTLYGCVNMIPWWVYVWLTCSTQD